MTAPIGVLPIDKPVGPTSHDIVSLARRALHTRKIGHTGTLDPFASGLLLLCLGPATRLAQYLTEQDKTYHASMVLGVATDTDDREGTPLRSDDGWKSITREAVEAALAEQKGEILQIPPQFSAKRVNGERMYDRARRGELVEVPAAPVRINHIELVSFEPPHVEFTVDCGSGTYIRAIARDVGELLGVGAHLDALRRTRVGRFSVDRAITPDQMAEREKVDPALLSPAEAVGHLPVWQLNSSEVESARNGQRVTADMPASDDPVALLDEQGELVGIGEFKEGLLQPRKILK